MKVYQHTTNIMLWHDNNFRPQMVKCVYDPAIFYTNEEFLCINIIKKVNIQVEIEKPLMYIIAHCPPTGDQIKYVNTRLEDLKGLKTSTLTEKGNINDMRFFPGLFQHPVLNFDTKKVGTIFVGIAVYMLNTAMTYHTHFTSSENINSRIGILTATTISQSMLDIRKLKFYENLGRVDIIDELHQRNVSFFTNY